MKNTFTSFDCNDIDFEVLFDDLIENKDIHMLLSLINDFESGVWRVNKFKLFILNHMSQTALTYEEREILGREHATVIQRCSERIREIQENDTSKNRGNGGEFGEAFLYGILKKYYKAFPVNPKIFYKQNRNDYAKGADSVHITEDNEGNFHLWLGESKFYKDLVEAISNAIQSIRDLLVNNKLSKEKSLIMNIGDLKQYAKDNNLLDSEKYKKLERILRLDTSLDELKKILHIPISIIYECKITQNTQDITEQYREKIKEFHYTKAKNIQVKLNRELSEVYGIDKVKFHIILFPIPSKEDVLTKIQKVIEVL